MTPGTAAPPDWYPDPGGAPCLRYWDGQGWTDHTAPAPPVVGAAPQSIGDDAGMRLLLPVGRSGWAIAAGYLGLVSWAIFPLAPVAIFAAERGRRAIAREPHAHGMGRVVVGYVGGVIGIVVAIAFLVAALTA